jgi:hypothetical protein
MQFWNISGLLYNKNLFHMYSKPLIFMDKNFLQ